MCSTLSDFSAIQLRIEPCLDFIGDEADAAAWPISDLDRTRKLPGPGQPHQMLRMNISELSRLLLRQ